MASTNHSCIYPLVPIVGFLLSYWSVSLKSKIRYNLAPNIEHASIVLVTKHFRKENRTRLCLCPILRDNTISIEYFKQKFIYDPIDKQFHKFKQEFDKTFEEYRSSLGMVTENELQSTVAKYGKNSMVIPMPTFLELFKDHVVAPFFIFQIFCTLLWMLENTGTTQLPHL